MVLNLEFSRQRVDDSVVRFTDVPVNSSSIMVDALSILSQFRRSAGWLYPIRPASPSDYERGIGRLILFGKNRIVFPDFPPPFYLEFFPRFGVSNYILSFYTGEYDASGLPGWVNVEGGGWWVNLFPDVQILRARFGGEGAAVYDFASPVIDAFVRGGSVLFRRADSSCENWSPYSSGSGIVSLEDYLTLRSQEGSVLLS